MSEYVQSQGKHAGLAIVKRLPAIERLVEIQTVTGLNYGRQSTPNDFVDIENMIIPPVYADVFVARDRWVKQISNDEEIKRTNRAQCFFSFPELTNYCRKLLEMGRVM